MRTNTIVLALVLSVFRQAFSQTASDTLRSLDSAWARSYATNDTVLAGKLFDDSLVVTGGNGRLKNKKGELADVGPTPGGQIHYFRTRDVVAKTYGSAGFVIGLAEWSYTFNTRDVVAKTYGSAGFVIGLAEWSYTFNGQTADYHRRYTAVYARGGPLGWRMVALHIGPAPGP